MVRIIRHGLIAAAVLITVLEFFGIRDFTRSPYTGILHHNLVIQGFDGQSPNRGPALAPGDRILSVDGRIPRNLNHYNMLMYSNVDFLPQEYTIARGDSVFAVTVLSTGQPRDRLNRSAALMVVGFTFILVGLIVILKRPDILGTLFTINCFIFSFLVTVRPVTSISVFHVAGELVHDFLFIFLPAFFLHFFMLFPGREIVGGTRRSRAIKMLYFPPAALFLSSFVLALWNYSTGIYSPVINAFEALTAVYWVVYMVTSLIVFIRTYMISEKTQRVKFRIVILGVALGIVPISIVILIKQFAPTLTVPYGHLSVVFLSFISITFAYAILKHDAFDMGIVFRKSLAFLILFVILAGAYYTISKVSGDRFGSLAGLSRSSLTVLAVLFVALAFTPARGAIQRAVDRAFYRNRRIFTEKVIEFNRGIQFLVSLDAVSAFLADELSGHFNAERIHIFLKDEKGNYSLRKSFPVDDRIPLTSFSPDTDLVRLMTEERLPLMIEYFDRLWISSNLDRISRELISIACAAVIVPLIEQHELLGFILLGRKRSGRPYSRSDSEVLELMSERTAVALKNISLYRDSLEKEKIKEELQIASNIQNRLLPESPPLLEGAVIRSAIKTSQEVGGDFYDFMELSPGRVGIAVADISGKGISAALLMTTLQTVFRAEASEGRPPAEVLVSMNDYLFDRTDTDNFATFFYAVYDDSIGLLQYSNAGSYPPFILGGDGRITRLRRGGTLLGLERNVHYQEGIAKLRPGDLLVIYTDGMIDQENGEGHHFGQKGLVEYFMNNSQLSLEAVIEKLFATVLAFGQNDVKDDMTVVLLRKNKS